MTSINRAAAKYNWMGTLVHSIMKKVEINGIVTFDDDRDARFYQMWEDLTWGNYQTKIAKLWHRYVLKKRLRNIARTAKIRNELLYLPTVGRFYFAAKESYESDPKK